MLGSHVTPAKAGLLTLWLIETLILACFLVFMIVELMDEFVVRNTSLLTPSWTSISTYFPTVRSYDIPSRWLGENCRWAQAKSQEHIPILPTYEYILHWVKKFFRSIAAMPLEVQMQTGILLPTKVTLSATQNFISLKYWASDLVTSICLWILRKQTWGAHHAVEDIRDALSHLPPGDEYRLHIPTTKIQGVLDTATIHKAYYILISTSLTFRNLRPAMRSAILSRIVHDVLNYDRTMGHLWSQTNTFALAAQLIQYQLNADWFDKSLQLQLANTETKFGESASDLTATFISMVFLISCGFPNPGELRGGATAFDKRSVSISREDTTPAACPTVDLSRSSSQTTRNSLLPGYSRLWHAMTRE